MKPRFHISPRQHGGSFEISRLGHLMPEGQMYLAHTHTLSLRVPHAHIHTHPGPGPTQWQFASDG